MRQIVYKPGRNHRPSFWPPGQFLTRHTRTVRYCSVIALVAAGAVAAACGGNAPSDGSAKASPSGIALRPGGAIVASLRTDARSFNRFINNDVSSDLVSELTQARLVRINKITWDVEPWLAESWTESADHLIYTLKLRGGVAFSDGQPFTADDVLF